MCPRHPDLNIKRKRGGRLSITSRERCTNEEQFQKKLRRSLGGTEILLNEEESSSRLEFAYQTNKKQKTDHVSELPSSNENRSALHNTSSRKVVAPSTADSSRNTHDENTPKNTEGKRINGPAAEKGISSLKELVAFIVQQEVEKSKSTETQKLCTLFLEELTEYDNQDTSKHEVPSVLKVAKQTNLNLKRKEKILISLIQSFAQEEEEWGKVESKHLNLLKQDKPNELRKSAPLPPLANPEATAVERTKHETRNLLFRFALKIDQALLATKEMDQFNRATDEYFSTIASKIHQETFHDNGIANPKLLFRAT